MTFSDLGVGWPTLDELKQWRDVTGLEWDGEADSDSDVSRFSAELEAAIEYVKRDVGDWDELVDLPTVNQSRAALRMAVLMRENAGIDTTALSRDAVYQSYMRGERRRFSIA